MFEFNSEFANKSFKCLLKIILQESFENSLKTINTNKSC